MKRGDIFKVGYTELEVEEGFNIRYDYGDIDALALSIKENGVKTPLLGYKNGDKFVITDGHRRHKAIGRAIEMGADPDMMIPMMPESKGGDEHSRTLGLIIYNDGKSLTLLEEALVYKRLIDGGMKQAEIATRVGKTATHISNLIKLANSPESLHKKIRENKISASLVIEELKNKDADELEEEIEKAVENNDGKKVSNKDLKSPKQKAIDFLKEKGMLGKKDTQFIITMNNEDSTEFDLVELMVEFKKVK